MAMGGAGTLSGARGCWKDTQWWPWVVAMSGGHGWWPALPRAVAMAMLTRVVVPRAVKSALMRAMMMMMLMLMLMMMMMMVMVAIEGDPGGTDQTPNGAGAVAGTRLPGWKWGGEEGAPGAVGSARLRGPAPSH